MQAKNSKSQYTSNPWLRETIDSFGVALILAFLFRAFVAEAFVIPTGSMAPTLMGAHKDVVCSQCGASYQTAASNEFNNDTGERSHSIVVGTTCPLCRFQQPINREANPNDATFSGDRILVSKLAYIQSDPERWQVFVFKNPLAARQNFIKRLVGLPNETLRVEHGDLYVKPDAEGSSFDISRKPPRIAEVHLQPLYDSSHRPIKAIQGGLPSPWQPEGPVPMPESTDEPETVATGWNVTQNNETWSAEFKQASDSERPNSVGQQDWLRYYHYTLKPWQWYEIEKDGKLSSKVLPRSAQLISDFTHYNANLSVNQDFDNVGAPDKFGDYRMERVPFGLMITRNQMLLRKYLGTDGMNWVGDLASEFDLQLSSDKGTLAFDLVEAGVHYMLQIDAASGDAQLQAIENGQALKVFGAQGQTPVDKITASTSVRGNSSVSIKYANVDDTLHLWVNGSYIEFKPTNFSVAGKLANNGQHRPQFSEADSADAAPIGIAMSNGMTGKIARAKVWRDIYYTAVNDTHAIYSCDYFPDILSNYVGQEQIEAFQVNLPRDASPKSLREYRQGGDMAYRRDIFFGDPRLWANSDFFGFRRSVEFQLGKDQYFPMGDNSIESNDGRMWKQHFVERDLLIGRAALVFWPHPWNSPIPFMPNFRRMGIIR